MNTDPNMDTRPSPPHRRAERHARLVWVYALGALTLTVAAPVRAQVLQNGSFEDVSGPVDTFHGKTVYSTAASWTTTGDVRFTGAEGVTDGQQAATFNGAQGPAGSTLFQTFSTQAGSVYTVAFEFGAYGSQTSEVLTATASGGSLLGGVTASADGAVPTRFTPYSFTFTAEGASTKLSFDDTGSTTDGVDGILDDVRVTAAPEPSSVVAFAFSGLGVAGLILKAKKRKALS